MFKKNKNHLLQYFFLFLCLFVLSKFIGFNFLGNNIYIYEIKIFNLKITYFLFFISYFLFIFLYIKKNLLTSYEVIFFILILTISYFSKEYKYVFLIINYTFFKYFYLKSLDLKISVIFFKILIIFFILLFYQERLNVNNVNILELPIHFSLVTNAISYLIFYTFLFQIFYLILNKKKNYSVLLTFLLILILSSSYIKLLSIFPLILYYSFFYLNINNVKIININYKFLLSLILIFVFFSPLIFSNLYLIEILHDFYLIVLKIHSSLLAIPEKSVCDELIDKILYDANYLSKNLQLKYPVLCFSYPSEPPLYGLWIGLIERIQILQNFISLNFDSNFQLRTLVSKMELRNFSHNSYLNILINFNLIVFLCILFIKLFFLLFIIKHINFTQFILVSLLLVSHLADDYLYGNRAEISFLSFIILGVFLKKRESIKN